MDRRDFLKKLALIPIYPEIVSNYEPKRLTNNVNSPLKDLKILFNKGELASISKNFIGGFEYLTIFQYAKYSEFKVDMLHIWITPENSNIEYPIYLCDEKIDEICNTGVIKKGISKEKLESLGLNPISINYNHPEKAVFHDGSKRFKKIGEENKEIFQKLYENTLDKLVKISR